jgi:HAE1 family hydrophobic/amphiphilic exporter-1
MCLGLLALTHLRVNQIPDVDMPVMVVTFPYPGASPESVERDIINRVEKSLQSIPQIYELRSTASDGQAQFVILFDFKKDMTQSGDEVRNAIRRGALQAADRDARAGVVPHRSLPRTPS